MSSPTSPKSPKSPKGTKAESPESKSPPHPTPVESVAHEGGRPRSASWLGKFGGDGRRRSGSSSNLAGGAVKELATSPKSPGSPSLSRANRSGSAAVATRTQPSLSLDLSSDTMPEVLGSLMFSPRADKLEESYVIDNAKEVSDAQLINSSGLSHFYKAKFRGQDVLQKVIKYRNIDDRVLAAFEKEVAVLSTLNHPNIVRFIGGKATPPDLFILLEWMAMGSLSGIILDLSREISWQQRVSWCSDIAKGIEYLHGLKPKIIHRDLRCDNVMVDGNKVAKITEFGLSRRKRFNMKASPRAEDIAKGVLEPSSGKGKEDATDKYAFVSEGGPAYTAPELLAGKPYTEKVDTYNFGVCVWQVVTRQVPHRGKKSVAIAEEVQQHNLRPLIPEYVPDEVKTLINECWDASEEKRPSFDALVGRLRDIAKLNLDPELPTEDIETSEGRESELGTGLV